MKNASFYVRFFLLVGCAAAAAAHVTAQAAPVNEISADLGKCSAQIRVTGVDTKPVFAAKVTTQVQHGFAGVKKLDLEAFTDQGGQVRISGIPASLKKPLLIRISKQSSELLVEFKPDQNCHAVFNVVLP
jgi:hypothetical protein